MTAIIVIIALVTFITFLDYGLFQRWQMSTSPIRNEVVFENRNQHFGAYAIRKDYDKNLVKIMAGLLIVISGIFGIYFSFKTVPDTWVKPTLQINETIIETNSFKTKDEHPMKRQEPQKASAGNANPSTTNPIIIDKAVVEKITITDSSSVGSGKTGVGDPFVNGNSQGGGNTGSGTGTGTGGDSTEKPPADFVDIEAQFPGGYIRMMEYIQTNLEYPQIGIELGAQGRCFVKFVIDERGKISNVKVVRGVPNCPECDREAVRVVKSMPEWIPGKIKGESVSSFFMLPIIFALQ